MSAPKSKYDREHLSDILAYQRMIGRIYTEASMEAARLGHGVRDSFDPDRPFSFDDYPGLKERVARIVSSVSSGVTATVMTGISREWALANSKNDALVRRVLGEDAEKRMTDALRERYFGANTETMKAFAARRVSGMDLSERVWKRTEPFKSELEDGIDAGLRDGLSAAEISRVIRQYLNHPDMRFRRVRDDHGNLVLSKRAAAYHPGNGYPGVYRSSYKNAIRLTGTEVNMAYRTADHERWSKMDFVVGIEIHTSNNHTLNGKPFEDICDELAGQYPKDFKFTGWHPQCRCYATSVLKTDEELDEDDRRILDGEEPSPAESSENCVRDVPEKFRKWVEANKDRIDAASSGKGTLPYFIKDNQIGVNSIIDGNGWVNAPELKPTADIPETIAKIDQAIEAAKAASADFQTKAEAIAKKFNATITPVNLKSRESTLRKLNSEPDGRIEDIYDLVRNTIVVKDSADIPKIIEEIQNQFEIPTGKDGKLRIKFQSTSMGYTGTLVNVQLKGVKGEIQINTPQMIYAKDNSAKSILSKELFEEIERKSGLECGLGHKYYEEWRLPSTTEERKRELEELSRKYYEAVRKVELAGNASVQNVKVMTENLASTVDDLRKLNLIETYEVKALSGKLTTEEIIDRLGGGDMTKGGSCASAALAYAGNKAGLDVLDFRGGESRAQFGYVTRLNSIVDKLGGKVCLDYSEFDIADALVKGTEMGKEYLFYVGKHTAIIRRTSSGFEYLELQHPEKSGNGFKTLDRNVLKKRFSCAASHRISGLKYQVTGGIVDIDLLKNDKYFKELLEFINTPAAKQKKGKYGNIQ